MAQAAIEDRIVVTPRSSACGAEISGVDLTKDLSPDVIRQIQNAWNEHLVLVFRGQELSQEDQLRFAAHFGPLGKRKQAPDQLKERTEGVLQLDPHVLLVSNKMINGVPVGAFGDGDMWYHIDSGYSQRPYAYTFLYGVELPSWGGDTLFSNMYMAYEALPADLKRRIAGKRALHVHEYKRNEKVTVGTDLSNTPHWFHPVVIKHPKTGRPSLFVDRLMTARIEGVSQEESDDILAQLYEIGEREEFVYAHKWQLGDFVMWDNLATIHARTYFPKEETRLLRRCTVDGEPVTAGA
jgi:taurine dioxygenase